MSKRQPALGHADARPRLHLRLIRGGAEWARHPAGPYASALSIGEAVEAAIDAVDHRDAVIIFEGRR